VNNSSNRVAQGRAVFSFFFDMYRRQRIQVVTIYVVTSNATARSKVIILAVTSSSCKYRRRCRRSANLVGFHAQTLKFADQVPAIFRFTYDRSYTSEERMNTLSDVFWLREYFVQYMGRPLHHSHLASHRMVIDSFGHDIHNITSSRID
jgi:hypothetical protein